MEATVINVIPNSLSGETGQDSEPSISVNPANPQEIVVTAFTANPSGGANAPIFVSTNGGTSWVLNTNVPSQAGAFIGTGDIKTAFSGSGGRLYGGILRNPGSLRLNILSAPSATGAGTMDILMDRSQVDQPFIEATTVDSGPGAGNDRFYTGLNDFNASGGRTASIDMCLDADAATPIVQTVRIEPRATSGQDGPQIRPAVHEDGTVYAVYYGWRNFTSSRAVTTDVVVVRDDDWGQGGSPFSDLTDPSDNLGGRIVTTGSNFTFGAMIGNERVGGDLSIAVDPTNSDIVYIAFCDLIAGAYSIHVRRSTDRGENWSGDLTTVANATNPVLAINSNGTVGFAFQQVVGTGSSQRWHTRFQATNNEFATVEDKLLADVPANSPAPRFQPYIGDYMHMVAHGSSFYGVFSANNTPDMANFPQGVTYQRNANFTTNTLQALDGTTPVGISIDPFFFKMTDGPILTTGFTRFTAFTSFTGFTRFTSFTPFTSFTRFTRLTPFTEFTRFTGFTRFTRLTPFTPFTSFTRFSRFTPFTPFTSFTRFSRFGPFVPKDRFDRWNPADPRRDFDPRARFGAIGAEARAHDEFIRFQNRIFAPEELSLGAVGVFDELLEPLAAAGITHLHQLAMASPATGPSIGLDEGDFAELIHMARQVLRGMAG